MLPCLRAVQAAAAFSIVADPKEVAAAACGL